MSAKSSIFIRPRGSPGLDGVGLVSFEWFLIFDFFLKKSIFFRRRGKMGGYDCLGKIQQTGRIKKMKNLVRNGSVAPATEDDHFDFH